MQTAKKIREEGEEHRRYTASLATAPPEALRQNDDENGAERGPDEKLAEVLCPQAQHRLKAERRNVPAAEDRVNCRLSSSTITAKVKLSAASAGARTRKCQAIRLPAIASAFR